MTWTRLLLFVVCFVSISECSNVTITSVHSLDGKGSMECGTKVILMCKIQPYEGSMNWRIDNTTVMNCISGSCQTLPPFLPNYGFAFEREKGIFNLTITRVTFEDHGKMYQCDVGPVSAQIVAAVKVVPNNNTSIMKSSSKTGSSELTVTTGCVYPTTNISFFWYIFKSGMNPVLYTNGTQTVQMNASTVGCTSGDCGGEWVTTMSGALAFQEDETGEGYFIQAVVSSSDFPKNVVVTSDVTYKIWQNSSKVVSEGGNSWLENKKPRTEVIVFSVLGGVVFVIVIIIIICVCKRRKENPETESIVIK